MGLLRSVGKALGGFVFVICLTLLIFFIAMSKFTEYDNLKTYASNIMQEQVASQFNSTELYFFQLYLNHSCENKIITELPSTFGNITLNCIDILTSRAEDLPKIIAGTAFDNVYYKSYDCKFPLCFLQMIRGEVEQYALLSQKAHNFFSDSIKYLFVCVVLGAVLLLVLNETWSSRFKSVGISCLFIGISYFLLPLIKSMAVKKLPPGVSLDAPLNQIFDSLAGNLLIILIIGIVITAIGFTISFLSKRAKK
jgi:heme/copper-type cytochrome/quinol oxidase subunit 4